MFISVFVSFVYQSEKHECVSGQTYQTQRGVRLSNLSPGNYSVRVRAISLAGNGSWTPILDLYVAESKRQTDACCVEMFQERFVSTYQTVCDPTGYQNILFAMIFVPIAIVFFVCLLVTMLVVLNKKRYLYLK